MLSDYILGLFKVVAKWKTFWTIHILFDDICDAVGPSDEWPLSILKLFCKSNVRHLFYPLLWTDVMSLARDEKALQEFKYLLHIFTTNPAKWNRAYAYNVLNHRFEFISAEVKSHLSSEKKRPNW